MIVVVEQQVRRQVVLKQEVVSIKSKIENWGVEVKDGVVYHFELFVVWLENGFHPLNWDVFLVIEIQVLVDRAAYLLQRPVDLATDLLRGI